MKIHVWLQTAVWLLLAAPVGAQEGADGPNGTVAREVQKLSRFSGTVEYDQKALGLGGGDGAEDRLGEVGHGRREAGPAGVN